MNEFRILFFILQKTTFSSKTMAVCSIKFPDIEETQLSDILPYVKKAVQFLNDTEDYTTLEVGKSLAFLNNAYFKDKHLVSKKAAEHGFGKLFLKIWMPLSDHYKSSDTSQAGYNLDLLICLFWCFTNASPDIACDLGKYKALDCIISTLKKLEQQSENTWKSEQLNQLLGILHNSVQHDECAANRSIYRQAEAGKPLKKLTKSSQMLIKLKSLLVFSYIANENDSEILGRDNDAITFLVDLLENAVESDEHSSYVPSKDGSGASFYVLELLKGLHNLVVNDANKQVVLKHRGIPVITRVLRSNFTEKEQQTAVMTLWNLSFNDKVRQSDDLKKACQGRKKLIQFNSIHLFSIIKNSKTH